MSLTKKLESPNLPLWFTRTGLVATLVVQMRGNGYMNEAHTMSGRRVTEAKNLRYARVRRTRYGGIKSSQVHFDNAL